MSYNAKEGKKKHYIKNREKYLALRKEYYRTHKKEIAAYYKNRHKTDINYRLARNLRNRLNMAIRRGSKDGSAVKDLGCTISELKFYMEGKFQDGMTWENWGANGWVIDHILPLACFNLSDREQFLKAVHYTNLQPLWAKDNLRKGNRLTVINSVTL